MNRDQAVSRIKSIEPAIRALGVSSLYLFGSTARNEAKATSDVDIFIDKDPEKSLGFIEFFDLEELLSSTLGTDVDLCTRTSLHPVLRADIEDSAIRIL
ncbi:MAG: nucleotidyltransferase domain-containing protein [Hyphomicrobium sp.]